MHKFKDYAPFTLGEALIRLIYSSLLCTVRSGIYAIFYLSGAVLGIPVPSPPPYVQPEGKANALAPPKDREYSAQRPAVVKEKASQSAPLEKPAVAGDTSSVPQVPPGQPIPTEADEMPPAPFNPDQPGALTPDLHELHQHGGFFIYMGFDPPKKGCNYSSITTTLLWLLWALPEECA
ncbi:hypothetical protein PoB_001429500 [Plakobranchus ocellatus]|uniref:Uncharacterized protein n=1 Tax=Plakobranchus ocellatus TaxID=259542 RepID=A0AAV3YZE7_9GAST|nr:hypothetical protein PoB_001429500 [Plakobranchus ocellatus]